MIFDVEKEVQVEGYILEPGDKIRVLENGDVNIIPVVHIGTTNLDTGNISKRRNYNLYDILGKHPVIEVWKEAGERYNLVMSREGTHISQGFLRYTLNKKRSVEAPIFVEKVETINDIEDAKDYATTNIATNNSIINVYILKDDYKYFV